MSPVAEKIKISHEKRIKGIFAPRPPMGAERAPRSFEITRCRPADLPFPELFSNETVVYFLSHEPVNPLDDPIDGIGTLDIAGEESRLTVEFAPTADPSNKKLFSEAAAHDAREHFPGIGRLTVIEAKEPAVIQKFEGIAA